MEEITHIKKVEMSEEAPLKEKSEGKSFFLELLESLFSSLIVLFLIYKFIAMPEVVHGASMYPNFDTGERILLEKVTKHFKPYERGEVVILHPPGNENIDYLKRVVALPGDIVKIKDCKVYINRYGEKFELQEYYLDDAVCTTEGTFFKEGHSVRLSEDEFLVLGDNRSNSIDSRFFGVVKGSNIQGRVVFRFWPLDRLGFL
ncbi:MAG TPA: signal peptidase I [candidate division WWE3 bacterium]|uniref:Signal peptidase I n=1 Tax=candidate division WWE3 bacterium TaxID=2053526 RepID=A0A7C1DPG1_UNCKA|nr:signal peptidase I [candidate division WWE3 bacterium]